MLVQRYNNVDIVIAEDKEIEKCSQQIITDNVSAFITA